MCTAFASPIWSKLYQQLVRANNGIEKPEFHLLSVIVGSAFVPIGLGLFALTARANVHWIVPIMFSSFFGFGCLLVFNGIFAYVFDGYKETATSAAACNSFLRSIMAGIFPLFGAKLYTSLGLSQAGYLLAGVALILVPAPIAFFKYGHILREKSLFTDVNRS